MVRKHLNLYYTSCKPKCILYRKVFFVGYSTFVWRKKASVMKKVDVVYSDKMHYTSFVSNDS